MPLLVICFHRVLVLGSQDLLFVRPLRGYEAGLGIDEGVVQLHLNGNCQMIRQVHMIRKEHLRVSDIARCHKSYN